MRDNSVMTHSLLILSPRQGNRPPHADASGFATADDQMVAAYA